MKVKSLKHNFIMYSIRTLLNLIFGIIIFPYVARKLGPVGIGKVQYAEAVTAYFLLFINLGILNYGKREVAFFRDDKIKLSKLVIELLYILITTTIFGVIFYFILINKVGVLKNEKIVFYIFSFQIIFNFLGVEWFYEGIENQTYITNRNIIFKIISGILILLLVKGQEDVNRYAIILVFALVGSNILNFIKLFQYIDIKVIEKIKYKEIKKHFKPLSILFFSVLALSISYNLDSIMIEKFSSIEELGYYSFASKMGKVPTIFTGAVVTVFYPRLCNLIQNNKNEEYINLTKKALNIILLIALPCSIGMYYTSDLIVKIFAGNEFVNSISIMKIFSIYIFIISIATFTGSITLLANRMEKIFTISLVTGSFFNFLFNLIFIPKIGAFGAAMATLITEGIAILIRLILGKKLFKEIGIFEKNYLKILVSSLMIIPFIILVKIKVISLIFQLLLSIIVGGIVYTISLIIMKEKMSTFILKELKNRFILRKKR